MTRDGVSSGVLLIRYQKNIDKLTSQIEYYDSSGKLIENFTDKLGSEEISGAYMLSGKDIGNKTVSKVKVSITDFDDKVICSDEYKL